MRSSKKMDAAPYFFLLPNLLIFTIFIIIPAFHNFYLSLYDLSPFRPPQFIGLGNFIYLFTKDDLFLRSLTNLAVFVVGDVAGIGALALLIGILLNQKILLRGFFRGAFFYPVLLSPVVVALVWQWILNAHFGALNALLTSIGLSGVPWLLRADWGMAWAILVHIWASVGFYALIVLAGLQSIPEELYEAAVVDGASQGQQFRRITFPLLLPSMLTVLILSTIRAFSIFDHIFVLTGGGPGTATLMMVQYIYRAAFMMDQAGLAAAASLVLFLIILVLTIFQYFAGKKREAI